MYEHLGPILSAIVPVALIALAAALLLAFVRIVRGPTLADRVVALGLMAYVILTLTGVIIIATGHPGLINVALAVGLVVFVGTVAFARYLERAATTGGGAGHG